MVTALLEAFGPERARELCQVFVSDAREKLDALQAAVDGGDATAAARVAHGLKSGSGFVGATGLQALAQEVERAAGANELAFARAHMGDLRDRVASAATGLAQLAGPCPDPP